MKLKSMTATILLAFCMACSTTDPIPDPEPSHPASSSATVPVIAGPSSLLESHDPLPQLSTEQEPDAATQHDHTAMDPDESPTEHDHSAMQHDESPTEHDHSATVPAPDADASEARPPAHDHSRHDPSADEPETTPPDAHDAHDAHDAPDTEPDPVVYACPMHPDQRSNEPADCPICGMAMEPVEVKP